MPKSDFTASLSESGQRIDRVLSDRLPEISRAAVQNGIQNGGLRINGKEAKASYRLRNGDKVEFDFSPPPEPILEPEALPLQFVYRDDKLAILEKPAGMVVHPGAGIRGGTMANALMYWFENLPGSDIRRPGIVHRLDRETSGLLMVALTAESHRQISAMFKERRIHKEYLALVYGSMDEATGRIDKPVGRNPVHRLKMTTRAPRSRPCLTEWTVEREYSGFTLLRLILHTGRTHQIRVHLSSIGRPIAGDVLYGGRRHLDIRNDSVRSAITKLDRFFLHASRLAFTHPFTGEPMEFQSPLPPELQRLLHTIEK